MAQNVLLACVMDLYLLGIHISDKKVWGLFERVQGTGHGLICFITVCLKIKVYWGFCLGFFEGVGFFVTM